MLSVAQTKYRASPIKDDPSLLKKAIAYLDVTTKKDELTVPLFD